MKIKGNNEWRCSSLESLYKGSPIAHQIMSKVIFAIIISIFVNIRNMANKTKRGNILQRFILGRTITFIENFRIDILYIILFSYQSWWIYLLLRSKTVFLYKNLLIMKSIDILSSFCHFSEHYINKILWKLNSHSFKDF